MQRALTKFTIKEVARTGRISLKRGDALLEMGGWGDGFRHNPPRDRAAAPASSPAALQSVDGDVYMVDKAPHGVWGCPSVFFLSVIALRTVASVLRAYSCSFNIVAVFRVCCGLCCWCGLPICCGF